MLVPAAILGAYFKELNYNELELNIEDVVVYEQKDTIYSVFSVEKEILTPEQFDNIQRQVYRGVKNAGLYKDNYFMVIVGNSTAYIDSLIKNICQEDGVHYVICSLEAAAGRMNIESGATGEWLEYVNNLVTVLNKVSQDLVRDNSEVRTSTRQEIANNLKKSTVWIAIVNIIIFVIMMFLHQEANDMIVDKFADNWIRVVKHGEVYRLVTAMFLHADADHLLGNMLSMVAIGLYIERIMGRGKFLLTYFVSGIIASMSSIGYNMYLNKDTYSLGASGAVYGLIGMFVMIILLGGIRLGKGGITRLLMYLVLSGWLSMSSGNIDHAAHIGGFIAGIILGVVMWVIPSMLKKNEQVNKHEN